MSVSLRGIALVLAATALLAACAPAGQQPGSSSAPQAAQAGVPRTLTIAINKEPLTIQGFTGGGASSTRGSTESNFVHNQLVVADSDDAVRPQLAAEVPSVEGGTWNINPDASMDMTWKLRRDAVWHDGTPFTSDDLLFTLTVYKDRDLPHTYSQLTRLMQSAAAPDPYTLTVHWTKIDSRSIQGFGLSPLPRHLLADLYAAGDKEAFASSSRFTDDFVGLGPYRMTRWERGSFMEFGRFEGYFLGKPPLDSILIRYIPDPNTMVANVLAGTVDVILPPSIDLDAALVLKRQWEGTANSVHIGSLPAFVYMEIQYRPELAKPANGFTNRLVRQAFFHATDRQTLADVMTDGASPIADSWLRPGTPLRRDVEASIPQYPYDPGRAIELLAQAGWVRNADGFLVSAQTGERFTADIWTNTKVVVAGEKQANILAQDWKVTGADLGIHPIPAPLANDREYGSKYPTTSMTRIPVDNWLDRLDSRVIAAPANDWGGRNKMGYVNPRVDVLLDRLALAVDARDQATVTRDLLQESLGDVAFIPLYWEAHPVVAVAGVQPQIEPNNSGWDAFMWDKK